MALPSDQSSEARPKILWADLMVARPTMWLALPPRTTLIPNGTCLLSTRTPGCVIRTAT